MLNHFVTFYVPSTRNVGDPLPSVERQALVTRVAKSFSDSFGGATATDGQGFYTANNGELIVESVTLVKSYHALDTTQALAIVIPLAESIKREYGQESIAIETETGIEFI